MKLTWFGGTTLRVYVGGAIVVVDADGAPEFIHGDQHGLRYAGTNNLHGI